MSDAFSPSAPWFRDSRGTQTYMGDMVTYDIGTKNGDKTMTARVERITFKPDAVPVVKVSGRSQSLLAPRLTRIDDSTLEGKLMMLVAMSGGQIDEDSIAALVKWIKENVNAGGTDG